MKLSQNWTTLSSAGGKKLKKKKAGVDKKVKKDVIVKKAQKSKIMSMVYDMNKEIEKQKENKKTGKEFEFKGQVVEDDTMKILEDNALVRGDGKNRKDIGKYVAMDCEFVGVGPEGKESMLARISLVNYHGNLIMDKFVKPRETVTDWRTWVSGIKPEHMRGAVTFHEAQKEVAAVLENRILVGHAVKHDLDALMLSHPRSKIIDTSRHVPFRQQYAKGKSPSLKKLAKEILKIEIQDGQHSSVEDARATMLLYKSAKKEFDQEHRKRNGH
ncbi:RNA exonuclease 4 [Nakaseomyces bracarensis]|uniref:RNA exonuclease 4 n=1 Tax=Nakaseomyces bracarensis TaxID=273131 RepID=A0ABR4NP90_9SACH